MFATIYKFTAKYFLLIWIFLMALALVILKIGKQFHSTDEYKEGWKSIGARDSLNQIYSAYFDDRLNAMGSECPKNYTCLGSVKIVSLFQNIVDQTQLECNIVYEDGYVDTLGLSFYIPIIDDNRINSHRTRVISCILRYLKKPISVAITAKNTAYINKTELVPIRFPKEWNITRRSAPQKDELIICYTQLWNNYGNTLRIVEFVEFQKILGASKFYIYNQSITEEVDKVLRYYTEHSNFTVLPWNFSGESEKNFYDNAKTAVINDCYYRASFIDNVKYIGMMDIDEILIPLDGNKNLLDFLKNQDRAYTNSFVFRHVFMLSPEKSTNNSLLYTQFYSKKSQVLPYNQRSKMVAKGKKLISIAQHWPELVSPETMNE
jgi:hypothetical protein